MKWWQWPEELKEEESRNKLAKATEEYENQLSILEGFEKGDKWSGLGESMDVPWENLNPSFQTALGDGKELNSGKYGVVWKTPFRGVVLARKTIRLSSFRKEQLKLALEEGGIVRKLDRHRHIVKIVGTCLQDFEATNWTDATLHILMFPVAHCDLAKFLDDCEEVSAPSRSSLMDLPSHLERLVALGFHASKTAAELRAEIRNRLKEMMGCLTQAVAWMHGQNIQHRDLKPANILVRPEQVLITDFGISRSQMGAARSTTDYHVGYTLGYAAPEVLKGDYYNAVECDIYSLGCVFLHLLTVVYGPNVEMDDNKETSLLSRDVSRERAFRSYLRTSQDASQPQTRVAHKFLPARVVDLLSGMMNEDGKQRPKTSAVAATLRSFSSPDEQYYGACCQSHDDTDEPSIEAARLLNTQAAQTNGHKVASTGDVPNQEQPQPPASLKTTTSDPVSQKPASNHISPAPTKAIHHEEVDVPEVAANTEREYKLTQTELENLIRRAKKSGRKEKKNSASRPVHRSDSSTASTSEPDLSHGKRTDRAGSTSPRTFVVREDSDGDEVMERRVYKDRSNESAPTRGSARRSSQGVEDRPRGSTRTETFENSSNGHNSVRAGHPQQPKIFNFNVDESHDKHGQADIPRSRKGDNYFSPEMNTRSFDAREHHRVQQAESYMAAARHRIRGASPPAFTGVSDGEYKARDVNDAASRRKTYEAWNKVRADSNRRNTPPESGQQHWEPVYSEKIRHTAPPGERDTTSRTRPQRLAVYSSDSDSEASSGAFTNPRPSVQKVFKVQSRGNGTIVTPVDSQPPRRAPTGHQNMGRTPDPQAADPGAQRPPRGDFRRFTNEVLGSPRPKTTEPQVGYEDRPEQYASDRRRPRFGTTQRDSQESFDEEERLLRARIQRREESFNRRKMPGLKEVDEIRNQENGARSNNPPSGYFHGEIPVGSFDSPAASAAGSSRGVRAGPVYGTSANTPSGLYHGEIAIDPLVGKQTAQDGGWGDAQRKLQPTVEDELYYD